jgi:hypothetical protein
MDILIPGLASISGWILTIAKIQTVVSVLDPGLDQMLGGKPTSQDIPLLDWVPIWDALL